jgi:TolA-binding protein
MAYKIRATGKTREFKKSEELLPALDSLGHSFQRYGAPLLISVGILLLVAGGALGYFWYQSRLENAAAGLAYEATLHYHQQPRTDDKEKKPVPTKAENFKKALELFGEVTQKYPRTRAAAISQYYIGNSHLELGQYEQAVSAYQTYLDRYHPSGTMTGLALERMGVAEETKGDRAAAEETFKKVLATEGAMNKDQVLFSLGSLLEKEDKKEDAVAQYKRILKDYPLSVLIPDARTRLKGLGVEPEMQTSSESKPESKPEVAPSPTQSPPGESDAKK